MDGPSDGKRCGTEPRGQQARLERLVSVALIVGFVLVSLLGVAHHFSLATLARMEQSLHNSTFAIPVVFLALLLIHTLQIIAFAVCYGVLLEWNLIGPQKGQFAGTWDDLIYFSGINFSTLGLTQIEVDGPIRLISMMQSLGGFMLLTWSASFLYTVCRRSWRK